MSSAAEAEVGALYMNARDLLPLRVTCEELGHPQPATPMRTDNTTAVEGILNKNYKQNRSKANDMNYCAFGAIIPGDLWAPEAVKSNRVTGRRRRSIITG